MAPGWGVGSSQLVVLGGQQAPARAVPGPQPWDCTGGRIRPGRGSLLAACTACCAQGYVAEQKWLDLVLVINILFYFSGFFISLSYFCLLTSAVFSALFCQFGISAWQKCCCSFIWPFVKAKDKSCWPGSGAE